MNQSFLRAEELAEVKKQIIRLAELVGLSLVEGPEIPSVRTMTKAELAALLKISPRTLWAYLKPHREALREMGVRDKAKVLPPIAVKYLFEKLVILEDEKNEEETGIIRQIETETEGNGK
ncbi:MAG: hypothetical protein E7074_08995 [Bacteroidales bacterium]|nr:hypothetical protein [Bacteroidales bacterium]